jgi:hypothetical protein
MHEMGIANSILEAADAEAGMYPGHRPAKVGVVIGEYAGVDTESLRFCFDVLAKERQPRPELAIEWRTGSDELKFAYLEMEEACDEYVDPREENTERKRSDRGAAA